MKITFLGTSHGVPAKERFCSCVMLESGGSVYLIDAGAPAVELMLGHGKRVEDFRALFTTHTHMDHTVGMLHLIGLMNWHYKECSAEFFITEQAHVDATKQWIYTSGAGVVDESRLRFHIPEAGVVYEDENIKVEYIPTKHMETSYAILVTEGEKRVLFGGDFSYKLKKRDIPDVICEEIDAFVCELAHFDLPMLAPYLEECRAKKVIFVHAKPRHYADVEAAKGNYLFPLLTPADGDCIEI
ncbi:MAG: ribonuclease Z [Clostridia bacterium]|nr:ribonuclease Z [Clostridia bacterium]